MNEQTAQFLVDLRKMIREDDLEYFAPWQQVPERYQKEFRAWLAEFKQQSWDGMEGQGWQTYGHEFIDYLIVNFMLENL